MKEEALKGEVFLWVEVKGRRVFEEKDQRAKYNLLRLERVGGSHGKG